MSIFSILFLLLHLSAAQDSCTPANCSNHGGPTIRFPFRLKDHHPPHCGYPGFDLSCSQNTTTNTTTTVLDLPDSVKVLVNHIDYKSQLIQISDPNGCFPRLLKSLNLSTTPFQFANYGDEFSIFSCPTKNTDRSLLFISCLSYPGREIYAADLYLSILYEGTPLLHCRKMYNLSSVPDQAFDQTADLQLRWPERICGNCEAKGGCGNCESKGGVCRWKSNGTGGREIECFKGVSKRLIAGVVVGSFLLLALVIAMYWIYRVKKIKKANQLTIDRFLEDYRALKPARYSYADIKKITAQFRDKVGQGGFGIVYRGQLSNEVHVAVKILNNSKGNGEDFINEVGIIGTIHHVNVVRLVGYCADGFRRALIYEFLPNDSLEKFVSSDHDKGLLGWKKLQDIAMGIAKGIEYLHQGCDQRILHFDIKPHNILLDSNFNPKISDFGQAKLCSKEKSIVSMSTARGTVGYIAPEVFSRNFGNVSNKSDIYSFGMLLLEMVGGKKNFDATVRNTNQIYFPEWIYNRLDRGEELGIHIQDDVDAKIVKKLAIVGLWCIQWCPVDRPSINGVIQMLEGDGDTLITPPNPFASTNQTLTTGVSGGRPFNSELDVIVESAE